MSVYFVTFPRGIEDVVCYDIESLSRRFSAACGRRVAVRILSRPVAKQTLQGDRPRAKQSNRAEESAVKAQGDAYTAALPPLFRCSDEEAMLTSQGLLYFAIAPAASRDGGTETPTDELAEFDFIYQLSFRVRTVEQIFLTLAVFPMSNALTEMDDELSSRREAVQRAVTGKLSRFRTWLGTVAVSPESAHPLPAMLYGDAFLSPITDDRVLFRVNSTRRDKTFPATSEQMAAHLGEQLFHFFGDCSADGAAVGPAGTPSGWRADMVYHHVEFHLFHDAARIAHIGLRMTPPPPPRCGTDPNPSRRYFLEFLRQRVGELLITGALPDHAAVKGLVTRPSATRYEMRIAKGENAMLVPLAAALVRYAAMGDRAGPPASTDSRGAAILLDPFGGSASVLLEAWVRDGQPGPLCALSGEVAREDYLRGSRNVDPATAAALAVMGGLAAMPPQPEKQHLQQQQPAAASTLSSRVWRDLQEWKRRLERLAAHVDLTSGNITAAELLSCDLGEGTEALLAAVGQAMVPSIFTANLSVTCADATALPYRTGSIDYVVTDMPFGRRCGTHRANRALYPRFLRECYRVLRGAGTDRADTLTRPAADAGDLPWWERGSGSSSAPRGGRAVLLTLDARLMMETLESLAGEAPLTLVVPPFAVDMAGLFPGVFVLDKY